MVDTYNLCRKPSVQQTRVRFIRETGEKLGNLLERGEPGWPRKGATTQVEAWALLDEDVTAVALQDQAFGQFRMMEMNFGDLVGAARAHPVGNHDCE
jgi:hypothetical protein